MCPVCCIALPFLTQYKVAAGFPLSPSGREHIRDPGLCSSQGCEEFGDKLGVPGESEMYKQTIKYCFCNGHERRK